MSAAPSPIGELLAVADQINQLAAGLTTPPNHLHGLSSGERVARLSNQDARRHELNDRLAAAVDAALRVETLPWLTFAEWSDRVRALRKVLADGLRLGPGDDYGAWCDRYAGPLERVDEVRARLTAAPTPTPDPPGDGDEDDDGPYTVADLREYVRYAVEYPAYVARLRNTNPTTLLAIQMGLIGPMTPVYQAAINCPYPGRITEEIAVTLPTYHWFVRTAREEHGGEQTVETFNLVVGMVAHRTARTLPELLDLTLGEFDALLAEADPTAGRSSPSVLPGSKPARRPTLEESKDEQARRKANVYRLILARKPDQLGSKKLLPILRQDRDLVAAVKTAGLALNEALIRAAVEYGRRNPDAG